MGSAAGVDRASRMLVLNSRMDKSGAIGKVAAEFMTVGAPDIKATLGPVISALPCDKLQTLIHKDIEEGATVVACGPGKPFGLKTGYYVKPTIISHVNNQMTVAREEIFGPVPPSRLRHGG